MSEQDVQQDSLATAQVNADTQVGRVDEGDEFTLNSDTVSEISSPSATLTLDAALADQHVNAVRSPSPEVGDE